MPAGIPRQARTSLLLAGLVPQTIRSVLARRKKTLRPFAGKRFVLLLDAHECFASYYRQCERCLGRTVRVQGEERIQYYHRYVLAYLGATGGYCWAWKCSNRVRGRSLRLGGWSGDSFEHARARFRWCRGTRFSLTPCCARTCWQRGTTSSRC
jgi:hypothetical protein